ncbi:FAD-binding domain-containing protein [Erythrobacter sp.]|uniref:FAD-binding domain-containing protein n=1 Tax=Erythrobacter sp. TaxID=1042 RepID=UPI001425DDAA|nr:FAD-binding domain-containing protein [Erythrobacter sp.]QIQ85301.1 MAG: DNA photolyase [Erythrobacter sp.]
MDWTPTRARALERLARFLPRAGSDYAETRGYDDGPVGEAPGERGGANVSQLSPWLHAGLVGEAEVIEAVLRQHSPREAGSFVSEVFWRVYFKGWLEQRPSVWEAYKQGREAAFARVEANAGLRTAYEEAVEGRTGIPAFDTWARELGDHGYLHNHARMWFASIWIFTLKLDWELGADFFLRHLKDGDAASNTLSWRWVGGLHTAGKTYLARSDNIARYTASRPGGPLAAEELADEAEPLTEPREHGRRSLDLPGPVSPDALAEPYALLLHDEAAHHVPLALSAPPALVIGAARPEARSPRPVGAGATAFARGAVTSGMDEGARAFGCGSVWWEDGGDLSAILAEAGIERLAVPYLPTGWTRDALMPQIAPLVEEGRVAWILGDLARATWPHARAGFFRVKKQIEPILGELGITGANPPEGLPG